MRVLRKLGKNTLSYNGIDYVINGKVVIDRYSKDSLLGMSDTDFHLTIMDKFYLK